MDNEKTRGMEGDRFVDAVLQMAHTSASAGATYAHGAYGRHSPPHIALTAFASLAAALRDDNRDAATAALAKFFEVGR
jgi:hypothetical protein